MIICAKSMFSLAKNTRVTSHSRVTAIWVTKDFGFCVFAQHATLATEGPCRHAEVRGRSLLRGWNCHQAVSDRSAIYWTVFMLSASQRQVLAIGVRSKDGSMLGTRRTVNALIRRGYAEFLRDGGAPCRIYAMITEAGREAFARSEL